MPPRKFQPSKLLSAAGQPAATDDDTVDGDRQIGSSGIQSIEVGAALLDVLSNAPGAMPLSTLASAAGMTSSKAHRYLASFQRVGLVTQNLVSGHYDLGPKALRLGLAAVRRIDIVQQADHTLEDLRDTLNEAVSLSVWGNLGPTIVHWKESAKTISIKVRLGSVTPLLTSAGGRVFAAYLPRAQTAAFITRELEDGTAQTRAGIRTHADVDAMIRKIDEDGLAIVSNMLEPGIAAISAPIFNSGGLAAAMTVVGLDSTLDQAADGKIARYLRAAASRLSRSLGRAVD